MSEIAPSSLEHCRVCLFGNVTAADEDVAAYEQTIVLDHVTNLRTKKRTLLQAENVQRLIRDGIDPERILAAHSCGKLIVAGECLDYCSKLNAAEATATLVPKPNLSE